MLHEKVNNQLSGNWGGEQIDRSSTEKVSDSNSIYATTGTTILHSQMNRETYLSLKKICCEGTYFDRRSVECDSLTAEFKDLGSAKSQNFTD